jgi:hypothetical protein
VRAGNVTDCVNHCEDDQTKGQRDANMRNCAASRFVDRNRACAGED